MPPRGQEWECKEEAEDTPPVNLEWDKLSAVDLEWQVGVWTRLRGTENSVRDSRSAGEVSHGSKLGGSNGSEHGCGVFFP